MEFLVGTARSIAGKAGLSGFVEEAFERLVTAKQLEQKGLERFHLPIEPFEDDPRFDSNIKERLGFDGKRLLDWGVLSIYRTKSGTFIVTDNRLDAAGSIYDYRTHDQTADLRNDRAIANLEKDDQSRVWDSICEALPPTEVTTWIE
jgi:hypothetical protein